MLNAMKARKIAKRKEKRYLRKKQKITDKALKRVKKEIQKGILTAINNGQYEYVCRYSYDDNIDEETQLKGLSILVNEEYLREYYQALGYIISIKDTGISARIEISWSARAEISWMEE